MRHLSLFAKITAAVSVICCFTIFHVGCTSLPLVGGNSDSARETVVLIHGMKRTGRCMNRMKRAFMDNGYNVVVCNYVSDRPVEVIATNLFSELNPYILAAPKVNFVTHSLGGIILRQAMRSEIPTNFGRAVMIGPPNHGSELIDSFAWLPFFKYMWGTPSLELGTGNGNVWSNLPPVNFPAGIIIGDGGVPPLSWFLPGDDDGKVSVKSAHVSGVSDYRLLNAHHTYMTFNREIISNAVSYIKTGKFLPEP